MMSRVKTPSAFAFAMVAFIASSAVAADLGNDVFLHGYGSWIFGKTDGNVYLNGNEAGSYKNADFALNISASPAKRLTIFGQVQFHVTGEGQETELDYAFADWRLNQSLHFRIGQVKHPFGIYAEIFDVGTLRPFFDLPQGIYGPQGIVAEAYRGIGLAGSAFIGNDWGLQYDVYFGELEAETWHPGFEGVAVAFGQELGEEVYAFDSRELIGGRLIVITPVPDLTFGVSFYSGKAATSESDGGTPPGFDLIPTFYGDRTTFGFQCEYLGDALWVRAEYAVLDVSDAEIAGSYAEIAYKFGEHWQIAGRYDRGGISGIEEDPAIETAKLVDHEDLAASVNYWLTPEMVIRIEYHKVDGTRFAAPPAEDYLMGIFAGTFKTTTDLIQVGAQFSF